MAYEYTDEHNGAHLVVNNLVTERDGTTSVDLAIYVDRTESVTRAYIRNEAASAVALAILEAAGIGHKAYQPGEMRHLTEVAHDALTRHEKGRAERKQREAEDLRVADFFTAFEGLTPAFINDHDRARYRAARKFFEETR